MKIQKDYIQYGSKRPGMINYVDLGVSRLGGYLLLSNTICKRVSFIYVAPYGFAPHYLGVKGDVLEIYQCKVESR